MRVVLVYNLRSGSTPSLSNLRKLFKKYEIEVVRAIEFDDLLAKRLRPYIQKNEIIVAIGGDGTMSAVAGLVAHTKATLAPLSGGTLNHFTKDLGVHQELEEAIRRLRTAKTRVIDIASVNGSYFINNSGLGLYPTSLRTRKRYEEVFGKWMAAVLASLRALVRFTTYSVMINGKTVKTPFIFVGNNRYQIDTLGTAVRDQLDEGVLTVFIAKTTSRGVLAHIVLEALLGRAHALDEFDVQIVAECSIKVRRHRSLHVARDGEVQKMRLPITYKIHPAALRVRH